MRSRRAIADKYACRRPVETLAAKEEGKTMHELSQFEPSFGQPQVRRQSGGRVLLWILVGAGVVLLMACGGAFSWLAYIGTVGPDTFVYAGNQVPARFVTTIKSAGALDDDETILYFYSDAMVDIRDGFYFVSDRKVAIYSQAVAPAALTTVRFDEIAELDIYREESFFEDSQIVLELKDGRPISFPVSSEADGDQRFFDAIKSRVDELREADGNGHPNESP